MSELPAFELPALLGGPATFPAGPPGWPPEDPEVRAALDAAYRDGSWGRYAAVHVERLELALREFHDIAHVLTCASGTFAVELGLRALRVEPGDEVILSAYDYPGNILAVYAVGAHPVLVDIAPHNWCLAPAALATALGPRTRAVIASHLHGGLVPMAEVTGWAKEHGLAVLEDAAQAPGASVQGRRAGTWGDASVLSFGGSKLLTAGRGGALMTSRADVWQRAHAHLSRGNLTAPLSELQAAVLLPQLRALERRHEKRSAAVCRLRARLSGLPGLRALENAGSPSSAAYYKLGFQFDAEAFGLSRSHLVAAMRAEGVALDEGFRAAHIGRSPRRYRAGSILGEAERAHHGCVVLHHPVLLGSDAEIDAVAEAWHKVHRHAALLAGSAPI